MTADKRYPIPTEIAPECCIVCGKENPHINNAANWSYLAGSTPIGAMACSKPCLDVAIQRHKTTGRVDTPKN